MDMDGCGLMWVDVVGCVKCGIVWCSIGLCNEVAYMCIHS